jgi:hypothetical protein
MATHDESLLWAARAFVYQHFAATARPPEAAATASKFGLDEAQAAAIYAELHKRHALFLEPGTSAIRMAFPFSGVPTSFRVHARGRTYFANCAWDALGIPAALQAPAAIQAACASTGAPIGLSVQASRAADHGERIHFLVPFRHWYNDLPYT